MKTQQIPQQTLSDFGIILLFMLAAICIICVAMLINRIFSQQKPNAIKLSTYESGEEPIGNTWGHFNVRFYVIGLIFLLFEVELLFLFPWAVVFADKGYQQATQNFWGWFALIEVFVFILILAIGLGYVWKKGFLDWEIPKPQAKDVKSFVPKELYDNF
jgi:NADH-quinone oxidoreductase subunit A